MNTCQETGAAVYPFFSHDFPSFTVAEPGPVTVAWTGLKTNCDLWVLNAARDTLRSVTGSDTKPDGSLEIALQRGTYSISVDNERFGDSGATIVDVVVTGAGCPSSSSAPSSSEGLLVLLGIGLAGAGVAAFAIHEHNKQPRPGQARRRRR